MTTLITARSAISCCGQEPGFATTIIIATRIY
jgi:hypothetical protein